MNVATTNKSHPAGVWRAVAVLALAIALPMLSSSCATRAPANQAPTPAATSHQPEEVPQAATLVFGDILPGEMRLCVPKRLVVAGLHPYACVTLRELRAQLRSQRFAGGVP